MGSKSKNKVKPFSSSAAGIGAAAAPALAMYLDMPSQYSAVSGLVGLLSGALIKSYSDKVFGETGLLANKVEEGVALAQKIQDDFSGSVLHSPNILCEAYDVVINQLTRGYLLNKNDPRIQNRNAPYSLFKYLENSFCWHGEPSPWSIELCQQYSPFRIGTAAIHPAWIAVFDTIVNDFGIELDIDCSAANGISQVEELNAGKHLDFAIIADANMFQVASKGTIQSYRILMPCFIQQQFIVSSPNSYSYDKKRLWIADCSTAEAQYKMKTSDIIKSIAEKPKKLDISDVQNKFLELNRGETILAWDPIISLYRKSRPDLVVTPTNEFMVTTSLYCHTSFNSPLSFRIRSAFQEVLIAAWNKACLSPMKTYIQMLKNPKIRNDFVQSVQFREKHSVS